MKSKALCGKVVVVTRMQKIPKCCAVCGYYDSMGGQAGRGNDGACLAQGGAMGTRSIAVSKERLPGCPLVKVGE